MEVGVMVKLILCGHENMSVWMACSKSVSVYYTVGRLRLGKAKSGGTVGVLVSEKWENR